MQPTNNDKIKQEFKVRRTRQLIAIGTTLALLLLLALLYNHTHILEGFAKKRYPLGSNPNTVRIYRLQLLQLEMSVMQQLYRPRHQQACMQTLRRQVEMNL